MAAAHAEGAAAVVATDGSRGCFVGGGSGGSVWVPGFDVQVVSTLGAGDVFHAGFIYGLLQGWPLPRQLDFACAAAALNCTASGARGGIGPLHHVESLMATTERYAIAPAAD